VKRLQIEVRGRVKRVRSPLRRFSKTSLQVGWGLELAVEGFLHEGLELGFEVSGLGEHGLFEGFGLL